MQNIDLRQVSGLTSKYRAHLIKAGFINASEVLLTPPNIIAKRTKLPRADVEALLIELSTVLSFGSAKGIEGCLESTNLSSLIYREKPLQMSSPSSTAADTAVIESSSIDLRPAMITTGDDGIDSLLDGGVPLGTLTEIAGQSGSGKSHLCLQLALTAQLSPALGGVSGGTIFISSEGMVPSSRLLSLATDICMTASSLDNSDEPTLTTWDLMDNVHTQKAQDVESLDHILAFIVPAFIERMNRTAALGVADASSSRGDKDSTLENTTPARTRRKRAPLPIKLIIVDSIAAPFRAGHTLDSSAGLASRAKNFGIIGDRLKRLAHAYDCAVVVVNQVTDVFDGHRPPPPFLELTTPELNSPKLLPRSLDSPRMPSPSPSTGLWQTTSSPMNGNGCDPTRGKPAHMQYGLPALLYNRYQGPHFSGQTPSFRCTAALGHSWSNVVNTRLMLSRTNRRKRLIDDDHDESLAGSSSEDVARVRKMSLVFSPFAPRATLEYVIIEAGVRSIGLPEMRRSQHDLASEGDGSDQDPEIEDARRKTNLMMPPPAVPTSRPRPKVTPDPSRIVTTNAGISNTASEAAIVGEEEEDEFSAFDIIEDSQFDSNLLLI